MPLQSFGHRSTCLENPGVWGRAPGYPQILRKNPKQRGNLTAIAVLSYLQEHNQLPESLEFITDDFKIDPYSGKPFVYKPSGNEFILYSIGVDRDDDGGQHHQRFGVNYDAAPDGDFVFWPIPGYKAETNSKPNTQQLGTTDNEITRDKSSV